MGLKLKVGTTDIYTGRVNKTYNIDNETRLDEMRQRWLEEDDFNKCSGTYVTSELSNREGGFGDWDLVEWNRYVSMR